VAAWAACGFAFVQRRRLLGWCAASTGLVIAKVVARVAAEWLARAVVWCGHYSVCLVEVLGGNLLSF